VIRRSPALHVHILHWDIGFLRLPFRGSTPFNLLNRLTCGRLHFRIDSHHPPTHAAIRRSSSSMTRITFCGGIDMSGGRWDTRGHRDHERRRINPHGKPYGPWHTHEVSPPLPHARAVVTLRTGTFLVGPTQKCECPIRDRFATLLRTQGCSS